MMRRRSGYGVMALLIMLGAGPAAAEESAPAPGPAVAPSPAPAAPSSPAEPSERLDGTRWALRLTSVGVEPSTTEQDTVSFTGRQMTSERLTQAGYPGSNCTVTVKPDGAVSWETMQTSTAGDVVFWRGEARAEQMSGVLTSQPAQGPPKHFSFTASRVTGEQPPLPPPPAPVVGPSPAAVAAPAVPEEPTPEPPRKRRWLWKCAPSSAPRPGVPCDDPSHALERS